MLTVPCEPNVPVGMIDMGMSMYFGEARQRTVDEYKNCCARPRLPTGSVFSIVEARRCGFLSDFRRGD